jgi:hypothetical protein
MELSKGILALGILLSTSAFSNYTLFNNSDDTLLIKYQFCQEEWDMKEPGHMAVCTDKTQTPSILPHSQFEILNQDYKMRLNVLETDVISGKGSYSKQFEKVNLFFTSCNQYHNNSGLLFNTFDDQQDVSCSPGSLVG